MLACQAMATFLLTGACFFQSKLAAYSFLLGALIYILANAYFALYAFRYRGSSMGPWITRSFSWGESGKLALTAVGFALVFRLVQPLSVAALFAGFCSMILLQCFVGFKVARAIDQQGTLNELDKPNKAD